MALLLIPGTCAASVARPFQDLFTPGLAPSYDERWVEWESFHWEMNHYILLPRIYLLMGCIYIVTPAVHTDKVHPCQTHYTHALTMGSKFQSRPHPRPSGLSVELDQVFSRAHLLKGQHLVLPIPAALHDASL